MSEGERPKGSLTGAFALGLGTLLREAMMDLRALCVPRNVLRLAALGLAIRLVIAPWTSWPFDMYPFYRASTDMLAGLGPYGHLTYAYPPLFALVVHPFTFLLSLFLDPSEFGMLDPSMVDVSQLTGMLLPFITHPGFNLAVKLPLIMADLLVGVVLYRFVEERKGEEAARGAFVLWFLNPLVIWVSSVYANFDVFPVLLTLVAMVCFMRRSYLMSGLALGLGFFFKLYPAYLILFYLALLVLNFIWERRKEDLISVGSFVLGGLTSLIVVLPFMLLSGSMGAFMVDRLSNEWFGGLNLWFEIPLIFSRFYDGEGPGLFDRAPFDSALDPGTLSTILLVAILALTLYLAYRFSRRAGGAMVKANLLVIAGILLLQPITNAHYLLWLFPFLIILGLDEGVMRLKLLLLTVSGVLYWLTLLSPLAFLYPLAEQSSVLDVATLNRGITEYFGASWLIDQGVAVAIPSAIGAVTLLSFFIPRRWDPVSLMAKFVRDRWGWEI
jgi:4-amino-4-deoxy-L-arabinose transferase-like glycosyltransferase